MAKVFISYSRKDINFAKRLTAELIKSELDFWIDWEGIPPTVDWWKEIEKGIEESDAFLFLISPDSVKSKVCGQEIDHAVKNGKRLLPIVVRESDGNEIHSKLKLLNWIFFRETDDFDASVKKLLKSIHTDYDWVQAHRRLQVKALEWERNHKENSFLLRGKDLQDAELQLATKSSKEPYPTDLHFDYISASRRAEDRQHRLSRRNKVLISIIGVVLLAAIGLALTGIFNRFIYKPVDMENYWVTIPAGEFLMGSSAEEITLAKKTYEGPWDLSKEYPQHIVYLDTYQIGKFEVTNRQYAQCSMARICLEVRDVGENMDLHPVVNVTWNDAKRFCEWVGGRLPTEAEWEKAARGTDGKTYPWGEDISCDKANYILDCVGGSTPVGSYESGKSPYGLYDMAGNVWEWVSTLHVAYPYVKDDGRENLTIQGLRVKRGGPWSNNTNFSRSALRGVYYSTYSDAVSGFRCARDVP